VLSIILYSPVDLDDVCARLDALRGVYEDIAKLIDHSDAEAPRIVKIEYSSKPSNPKRRKRHKKAASALELNAFARSISWLNVRQRIHLRLTTKPSPWSVPARSYSVSARRCIRSAIDSRCDA
jgi:hypothetical protein